ncbi:hypothetical protein [Micromonospora siamensis]|uniref:hypothetical protein n=1 Tax=Micromonospora siamensis TaxID=299152 RepID=UPI0015601AC3|nr:hypothetical protein [Micromonospora siamensis]
MIFFALALKDLLAEAADPASPLWGVPLGGFWITVFYGGVALYLLSVGGCAYLALRSVRWPLLVGVLVLAGLAPLAAPLPELVALGVLALVVLAVVTAETLSEDGRRRQVRQLALAEQYAAEQEQSRWRREHL